MASLRICSIPDCHKPARTRGWCSAHYWHYLKYGDPLGRRQTIFDWLEAHLSFDGEHCLIWPFGLTNNGYGKVTVQGRTLAASRYVCEVVHGPAPSSSHEAAHSCGNRSCVNPRHIRWATKAENAADKILHGTWPVGTKHGNAKLTEESAKAILDQVGKVPQRQLARRYGVTPQTIWKLVHGATWPHIQR